MKKCSIQVILLLSLALPVTAQDGLVFSGVEGAYPIHSVGKVLRRAYQKIGIQVAIRQYPGLRGLLYSDGGVVDGEAFRIEGIEKEYSNLIRIKIPVQIDDMYLYVKQGKEFTVKGWDSIPKSYYLGYVRGVKFIEYAVAKHDLRAETVSNYNQLFLKLELDRSDGVVAGIFLGKRYFERNQLTDIVRLSPPIHKSYLYHYLHKKHGDLVPRITSVLKKMEAGGEIELIKEQVAADLILQ